jgi:hypothetical protein
MTEVQGGTSLPADTTTTRASLRHPRHAMHAQCPPPRGLPTFRCNNLYIHITQNIQTIHNVEHTAFTAYTACVLRTQESIHAVLHAKLHTTHLASHEQCVQHRQGAHYKLRLACIAYTTNACAPAIPRIRFFRTSCLARATFTALCSPSTVLRAAKSSQWRPSNVSNHS